MSLTEGGCGAPLEGVESPSRAPMERGAAGGDDQSVKTESTINRGMGALQVGGPSLAAAGAWTAEVGGLAARCRGDAVEQVGLVDEQQDRDRVHRDLGAEVDLALLVAKPLE